MRRLTRWLGRIIAGALLIAFALWLVAYGRQWLLRSRAERLLADIQALQVQKSSWADAQRLMTRWGAWGSYEGSCTPAKCYYFVWMHDAIPWEYRFPWEDEFGHDDSPHRLARMLDRIGLRTSVVHAAFSVSNGTVVSKHFDMMVLTPVRYWNDPDEKVRIQLTAGASEGSRLNVLPDTYYGDIYSVALFDSRGGVLADSTPMEPLKHRKALMAFRLNCISQWSPCLQQKEILPQAAAEADARRGASDLLTREGRDPERQIQPCDARRLEFLARDEPEVWIGSVEEKPEHDSDSPDQNKLRYRTFVSPQKLMKSRHAGPLGGFIQTSKVDSQAATANDLQTQVFIFGFLEEYSSHPEWRSLDTRSCSFTPVTPETLAAVQKGVTEDFGHN
jgi:hypothetical protein